MTKRILIASIRPEAGKTSLTIGLKQALNKKIGYCKPLGNRIQYRRKRLWDFDSELFTTVFDLDANPEDLTIGFDHSKLKFMYDRNSIAEKLKSMVKAAEGDNDFVFIEGPPDLQSGSSIFLDSTTMSNILNAKLLYVVSASNPEEALDDLHWLKNNTKDIANIFGIILTQIADLSDFKISYADQFTELELPIIGFLPVDNSLNKFSMDYLVKTIGAKVIAGEDGLNNLVEHIFVGAMSASQVVNRPLWSLKNKLIITPGDRTDMILASLESQTAGVVLTNNILPTDSILLSKSNINKIPLILVQHDTFSAAKMIDKMEILFTKNETSKIEILKKLVIENIDLTKFE